MPDTNAKFFTPVHSFHPLVGNLTSGSSATSKSSLDIWKFTVQILLKPGLGNFEHYIFYSSKQS